MNESSQESRDLPSVPPVPEHPVGQGLHFFYYRFLDRLEWATVIGLLAVVVILSFAEVINRNFGLQPWDPVAGQKAVYALTFYLGLYGAVLATRHGKHIAIDVVGPHLSPKAKSRLEVALYLIAAFACLNLCRAASTFVTESIEPDISYISHLDASYWRERVWRWPAVPAFALMAVHFLVGALSRALGWAGAGEEVAPSPGSEEEGS